MAGAKGTIHERLIRATKDSEAVPKEYWGIRQEGKKLSTTVCATLITDPGTQKMC